jgi:phospholipid/cholesterol/gamma-HCH transport system substrate-binding protein
MNPTDQKTNVFVGLFVFCGLLLLGGLILQFSNIREVFRKNYPIHVTFRDSGGLTKNSPIRYSGTHVGRVAGLSPQIEDKDGIRLTVGVIVHLEIHEGTNIPRGSRITIGKEGLLGDAYINITPPMDPIIGVLSTGDTIAGQSVGTLDDLQDAANEISQKTQIVLEDIRKGLLNLDNAIKKIDADVLSQENRDHFKQTLASLDRTVEKLDTQILDDENSANLKKTLANLGTASENLATQSERIDEILDKGEVAMKSFGEAADTIKQGGRDFATAAGKAGRTVSDINSGAGLMSALIHDPQLRTDFKHLIANLRERGILFYKDKADERTRQQGARPAAPPPARSRR